MYARDVDDRTLTFRVSGMLWQSSLVMVDQETKSYWSHLLGEAMKGPLKGRTLEVIPSVLTDWKVWKQRYPETTVVFMKRSDTRFRDGYQYVRGDLVLGLQLDGHARCWPLPEVARRHFVADQFRGQPLLVTCERDSRTASIFERRVGDQVLEFSWREGQLRDDQTGSRWDAVSGHAVEGPLAGAQLRRLPGFVSAPDAWKTFHPDGSVWKPSDREDAPSAD